MLLDAMLIDPQVMWLGNAKERLIQVSRLAGVSPEGADRLTAQRVSRPVRSVRDRMPVGIDQAGRWVFQYLLTEPEKEDFHWFLQQHWTTLAVLPAWVIQIVCLSHGKGLAEHRQQDARLAFQPVRARIAEALLWYFKLHRAHTQEGAPIDEEEQDYYEAREAFGAPRFRVLHRRWMIEGDAALEGISSGAIANALETGAGRIECHVLPFAYRHLSPLVDSTRQRSQGAEDMDNGCTPPRPLSLPRSLGRTSRPMTPRRRAHDASKRFIEEDFACASSTRRRNEGRRSLPPDSCRVSTAIGA